MNIDFSKIFQSRKIKITLLALAAFIVLLIVFQAGMAVGFRKANFSFKWGENYQRNFGGPRGGFLGNFIRNDFVGKDFINGHGVFGQIIKIDGSTIIIKGADNAEKIVLSKDDTAINRFQEKIKVGDLKVDDQVIVIGSPNNAGQIEAKLIRVMPASLAGGPLPFKKQIPMPPMRSR
jgi:hypothetical protein